MYTKTVSHTIETPLEPLQVLATLPANDSRKTPISITISGSSGLACYHYAIPFRDQVVGSLLVDNQDDTKRDFTRQLATLLAKKYHRPCYVAYACSHAEDQLLIIRRCVEFLQQHI